MGLKEMQNEGRRLEEELKQLEEEGARLEKELKEALDEVGGFG